MKILLYNPDNGVTRNFMPHLWMFLLQSITPPGHEVLLVDGNAHAMNEDELVRYVQEQGITLVGIGAMTRMVAKAYRMADALRAAGVMVVMGGPHVTEVPDEALGRDGGPRHADAIALGEADETWPLIVADAARGELKDIYIPENDEKGSARKPSLQPYPSIPWETLELDQFNIVPKVARPLLGRARSGWNSLHIIPIETGRGCPYGCEFCTVTGFFGDSIRFRTNESVVDELLRLKARARQDGGQIGVFFIDDNLAINIKRTKSLLRAIITAGAQGDPLPPPHPRRRPHLRALPRLARRRWEPSLTASSTGPSGCPQILSTTSSRTAHTPSASSAIRTSQSRTLAAPTSGFIKLAAVGVRSISVEFKLSHIFGMEGLHIRTPPASSPAAKLAALLTLSAVTSQPHRRALWGSRV